MQGDTLSTDGKKLEKGGLGAQTIATSSGGKFKIVAKMDGRQTQSVVQYIKKSFPKDVVEETPIPFSQKVQEQIRGFDRESLLAEDTVDVLKSIVKNKAMKPIKLKDGTMKVDLFTASAIVKVLDKINPANKAKLTKMLNGKKSDFMRAADGIMRIVGKSR